MNHNDQPASFPTPGELRLVRLLPGPIERVREYLTDPEKRSRWFAGGLMEQRAGGKVAFALRHASIAPDETPPDRFKHVHDPGVTFEGRMLRCEPPRLLSFTFGGDDSEVTIELTPEGGQVRLVLTHRAMGEDRPELGSFAAGWHTHLGILNALLADAPRPPLWPTHARLRALYEQQLASHQP